MAQIRLVVFEKNADLSLLFSRKTRKRRICVKFFSGFRRKHLFITTCNALCL